MEDYDIAPARGRQCFPRAKRLRKRWEFRSIQRRGQRLTTRDLIVLFRKAKGVDWDRIGITVSRKAARRAVVRNRIKRWIREAFRRVTPAEPPLELVVVAKPSVARSGYASIASQVATTLERARKILRERSG